MARFDTSGIDALMEDMRKMGELSGDVAEAMTNAAAAEIRDAWKESAEAHGHRVTGDMIASVAAPGAPVNVGGTWQKDIYPLGKDRHGVRNADKAFILNYGTSRVKPTYWVDEADAASETRVQSRLEAMWGEFLDTGKVPAVADTGAASSGSGIHTTKK